MASAKHVSVNSSLIDLVPSELGHLRAGSKTHLADASPGLGAIAGVALVGTFLGGAVRHDDEGYDDARKGRVRPGALPVAAPVGKGHLATLERGNISFTTTSRLTGMVFRWLDRRTST